MQKGAPPKERPDYTSSLLLHDQTETLSQNSYLLPWPSHYGTHCFYIIINRPKDLFDQNPWACPITSFFLLISKCPLPATYGFLSAAGEHHLTTRICRHLHRQRKHAILQIPAAGRLSIGR